MARLTDFHRQQTHFEEWGRRASREVSGNEARVHKVVEAGARRGGLADNDGDSGPFIFVGGCPSPTTSVGSLHLRHRKRVEPPPSCSLCRAAVSSCTRHSSTASEPVVMAFVPLHGWTPRGGGPPVLHVSEQQQKKRVDLAGMVAWPRIVLCPGSRRKRCRE
jgi:hypothetical protein